MDVGDRLVQSVIRPVTREVTMPVEGKSDFSWSSYWMQQLPSYFKDGNTIAYYDYNHVESDVSDKVNILYDSMSKNGPHMKQYVDANKPKWETDGLLFSGKSGVKMLSSLIYEESSYTIGVLLNVLTWGNFRRILDGIGLIQMYPSTPKVIMYKGTIGTATDIPINSFFRLILIFNGANSKIIVDGIEVFSGNVGTTSAVRIWNTLAGPTAANTDQYSNIKVKDYIIRKGVADANGITIIDNHLISKNTTPSEKNINIDAGKRVAGICLTFDDNVYSGIENVTGWLSADDLLSQYGWKAGFGVTSFAATHADRVIELNLYKDGLLELAARGHELTNHTLLHTGLDKHLAGGGTRQQYYDNFIKPQSDLMFEVLGIRPNTYQYSDWYGMDKEMSNLILQNGYSFVRENIGGAIPAGDNIKKICYDGFLNTVLSFDIAPYSGNTYTDAQILALLDYAKANNLILNIFSHRIVDDITAPLQVTKARLEMICQYIVENNMKFYRQDELKQSLFD